MAPYRFISRDFPLVSQGEDSLPIWLLGKGEAGQVDLPAQVRQWADSAGFTGTEGRFLLVPGGEGELAGALFGLGDRDSPSRERHPFIAGKLADLLPEGTWHLENAGSDAARHALGFAMGAYRFETFRKPRDKSVRLAVDDSSLRDDVERIVAGVDLARDLINTPANHMGPAALEAVTHGLAGHYGADLTVTSGEKLLAHNLPLIHAVGRAAAEAPRLLDLRLARPGAAKVTLVGKGVCFDTGGLDLKPSSSMLLMKKDMGGAANVLGLALMIMDAGLDIDLRVLIPAVENSVAGNAFRPGDILQSRKGPTIQVDNTDAEGRLVLADALTLACEESPALVIDMATLTGAARVALGPELPPLFTDDDALAGELAGAAEAVGDPLWRMPLYPPYKAMLETPVADLTNAPAGGFAGAITAALFLQQFVEPHISWCHFDIFGWMPKAQPHAPIGGQAYGIRALFTVLAQRYPPRDLR
ncbi:leucyl aminopeptidase family protein [Pseudohoeflea coraliihabitans]|uniref:Leucyl aminopeptidase family protein n=1 Tax=Pseudohoeflea coraliihabitans TaxID=2860393 RepID=A0ABS6WP87_9HYPH|nr:leucyl aminopeptidase family protein [Pseudohoeflea sp. DP4N28-3]MBW3097777.1 leucyl aminopeptidase family protein [Pseudohoeflea sp. DP4N28-3]